MSLGSTRTSLALELAPHQLNNCRYNAQGSISPYLLPSPQVPIVFDSVTYPAVDGQFANYYATPRVMGPASEAIGIYSGYRDFQSTEPNTPSLTQTPLPPLGRPMKQWTPVNYFGCK